MKKCYRCSWASDKCKNPFSKNKDKYLDDIKKCDVRKAKKPAE